VGQELDRVCLQDQISDSEYKSGSVDDHTRAATYSAERLHAARILRYSSLETYYRSEDSLDIELLAYAVPGHHDGN
jgi:hypothetical protein